MFDLFSVFILGNVLEMCVFCTFLLVYISAVKQIQNKSFCFHNMCVLILCIFIM